jgi:hypothetical protein
MNGAYTSRRVRSSDQPAASSSTAAVAIFSVVYVPLSS